MLLGTPISSCWRAQVGNVWDCTGRICLFLNKHRWDCWGRQGGSGEARSPGLTVRVLFLYPLMWPATTTDFPSTYLLSITYLSFSLTMRVQLPAAGMHPASTSKALFRLYTSSAYLRPNFKSTRDELLSWQNRCWKLSKVISSQRVIRDALLVAVCLNTCSCRSYPNCLSRVVALRASKSQTSQRYHPLLLLCSVPRHAYHTLTMKAPGTRQDLHYNSPSLLSEDTSAIWEKKTNNEVNL